MFGFNNEFADKYSQNIDLVTQVLANSLTKDVLKTSTFKTIHITNIVYTLIKDFKFHIVPGSTIDYAECCCNILSENAIGVSTNREPVQVNIG